MSWTDLLIDAATLHAIFGNELPTLKQVELHEVKLHRDGPKVELRFDVMEFPKSPPAKWEKAGFNCVQLNLVALGIQDLLIEGWPSQGRGEIKVSSIEQLIELKFEGKSMQARITSDHLFLEGISAYRNE